jgi:hypothetical protein
VTVERSEGQAGTYVFRQRIDLSAAELKDLNRLNLSDPQYHRWFRRRGGVDPETSHVKVVLQGNRDHTVRIIGMRAVKYCQPPLAGTIFDSPPAGAEESEWIGFDLDSSDTSARPRDRQSRAGISTRHYFEAKTISLKPGEQEVLQVLAKTWKYYCQYRIEMTVLDGSKTTTQMISNGDQPFQVTGVMVTDDHGINRIAYSRYRAVYLGGVNSP